MNGENKKGNNKKLILLFVGLIIIGIVCMKLKKTEQYEKQPEEPTGQKVLNQLQSTFTF
jgi:hypothetical protein